MQLTVLRRKHTVVKSIIQGDSKLASFIGGIYSITKTEYMCIGKQQKDLHLVTGHRQALPYKEGTLVETISDRNMQGKELFPR